MKNIRILTIISAMAAAILSSCKADTDVQNPYVRNTGEEYLAIDVDTLAFPGRGATLTFTASASYDATIDAPGWVTLTSKEIPGDGRDFTVTATAPANKMTDGGSARSGEIIITTRSLSYKIYVSQPLYERPDCPTEIADAETFLNFIELCAPYYEEGEAVEMTADIDMEGITLVNSAESFKGVLNGNGFKIKNWQDTVALFLRNDGVISDLVLDETCTLTVPSSASEIFFSPFTAKNYGIISGCTNGADIILDGNYARTNVGGFAACNYESGAVTGCINKGEIIFGAATGTATVFIGGIVGYNYNSSSITDCESYSPITCTPAAFSSTYQAGGIVGHHNSTGDLSGNIVHKEAKIYTNETSGSGKSYLGGIVGNMDTAPKTSNNQVYADLEINLKVESYIGGLQAFQGGVNDASTPSANCFEGSIVNTNITAYKKGTAKNGNNVCLSAGLVVGRFTGQKGKATTLHYGTADSPVKASGSITCIETGTKKVASSKDYQSMLLGDGSTSSVSTTSPITECDFDNITYKVCGDGQTGDAEDLIITVDGVTLSAAPTGGEAKFSIRGNYTMTVTPEVDWITADAETVPGDGEYHEVTLTVSANGHTYSREGTVAITMPMGSTGIVTVTQEGDKTLPESLVVSVDNIEADPAGMETSKFDVTANYDAVLTADDWITMTPDTVVGDEAKHTVTVTFAKNQTGVARQGVITIKLPKELTKTISINQEKFVYIPKAEIGTAADFLDFMVYGNNPELYPSTFEVKLTADIDLKDKTVGMIDKFKGYIDGQGHCLKNIKSDVPLFGQNAGTVKNIVLDSSCSFTLDPAKAPTNSSAVWTGALCGNVITGGTIIGCTNKASVTMTKNSTVQAFIGGIAGRSDGDVTVDGCVNEGSIIIKPSSKVEGVEYRVAGVVAGCNGTISNCVNNAPVEYSPADLTGKGFYLGGVVSYLTAKPMTNCINKQKGTVTFNPVVYSGNTQSYIGGLIGYVDKKTTVSGCSNFGNVKVTGDQETLATGGLTGWVRAGGAGFILFDGCSVNCDVTAVTPASGVTSSTNPLKSAGLVIGRVAQSKGADNVTCQIGTPEAPCKTSGSITVLGGSTATADASNYTNYLFGNSLTNNFFNSGSAKLNAENCIYEAVTKE